jgi:hypothetical protein
MSNPAHVALGVSSATLDAWLKTHAVFFTAAAAVAAILSGLAAFIFYCVSTYYKIKHNGRD